MDLVSDFSTELFGQDAEVKVSTALSDPDVGEVRVTVTGDAGSANADVLREALVEASSVRWRRLAVDLSAVTFCGSSMIELILAARTKFVEIVVIGASPAVRRLFALAGEDCLLR